MLIFNLNKKIFNYNKKKKYFYFGNLKRDPTSLAHKKISHTTNVFLTNL